MGRWQRLRSLVWAGLVCFAMVHAGSLAWATENHGQVFCDGVPVPGATVTVTQGAKSLATVTDRQGLYEFPDLADGAWKILIEMSGFTPISGEVTVAPDTPQGSWDLKLLGLEQIMAEAKVSKPDAKPLQTRPLATAAVPKKKDASKEEEAVLPEAPKPAEEASDRSNDGLLINGSVNNAATSPFSIAPAFGNRRPGAKSLYTGGIGAIVGNSVFDARPYSLTGLQVPKAQYSMVTTVVTLGGPLNIPHLMYHGPNFFLAYQWTRVGNATTQSGLVPDAAERNGDLSGLQNSLGQPVTIYNPATGLPFVGAIPVSPQAKALLQLYPLPNLSGSTRYNYQTQVLGNTHADTLQSKLDKTISRRDQVYGGFAFRSSRADNANLFNFRDTTNTFGIDSNVNWSHRFKRQFFATLGYHFTRLRTEVQPEFANRVDISGDAGIVGNSTAPADWGPPALGFSSGIASLSDGLSVFNRNRTDALSLSVTKTHRKHTVMFGGDFRRQEFNQLSQQNPRGIFTFTGAATQGAGSSTTSGSDLADFLLGVPDTSALAFGNADKYFRQSVYDAFITDDWRLRPELTLNTGIRWDYGAPLTELRGRLVNLDVASGFSAVAPVLGSDPKGPLTGQSLPTSLVRPDKRGFEPRIGISWRPFPASTMVVRAGYGIYDDTSVYLSGAESMAQQSPISKSLSIAYSSSCPLTLARGFLNCPGTTANTFAIDPNLRVGYAQTWQLSVQRDLPGAMVMTATYLGIKGTHGMQQFLPNTFPVGAANPCPLCPAGFVYRTSGGNSTRQSGQFQLRRRLRSGFTATLLYTYSKSLDDDAQVGAQGHTAATTTTPTALFESSQPALAASIAQDWLNLSGERGLSTFDQRHLLKVQMQYTTGMGLGGGTLLGGWRGRLLKEWTATTQIVTGSGLPETPIYLSAVPNTGFTGTIRPSLTGKPIYQAAAGYFLNAAAFSAPANGQWGTARRDSITGPSQFSLDGALARTFRLREPFNLDVRLDATNLLNHAVFNSWNTTVNSTTFGLPVNTNPMRSLQLTGRLRF
jgi:trimeric autotransporter adhesin